MFAIVSRQALVHFGFSTVICAPVFSEGHEISTQVPVGTAEGFKHDSVIFCDNLVSIAKATLTDYVGTVPPAALAAVDHALRIALEL